MSSIQKNLALANLSVTLDVRASQVTVMELMSALTARIESLQDRMLPEVRAQVVEASRSPFADEKFWQEVLAAVDSRHDAHCISRDQLSNLYEDPITAELMIDPVMASNGETYCRWTIIDNDVKRNPVNFEEALTIVVDNLASRRGLFAAFPEQSVKFQQRRQQYRVKALSWVSEGMLADAEVALQNVLRWDKNDKDCAELLVNVQRKLEKAKGKYTESSSLSTDKDQFTLGTRATPATPIRRSVGVSQGISHSIALLNQDLNVEGSLETHLNPMQRKLKKAKGKYTKSSSLSTDKDQFTLGTRATPATPIRRSVGVSQEISHAIALLNQGLQTHLNPNVCNEYLILSADKLSVKHRGPSHLGGAMQANRGALWGEELYYFEMEIKDCGSTGSITLGFTNGKFENSRHPKLDPYTNIGIKYEYRGQCGVLYENELKYASQYTTGDIVGAGLNYATENIFFTKNGRLLTNLVPMVGKIPFYATIGLFSCNGEVKVNFGREKFLFPIHQIERRWKSGNTSGFKDSSMCTMQ